MNPDALNDLLARIQSRCYWRVVVRPETFKAQRIRDFGTLINVVRNSSVAIRGWNFPHVEDTDGARIAGDDWVGESLVWREHLDHWRIFQSGQFYAMNGMWWDWQGLTAERPDGNGPVSVFPLWDAIYRFTEVYEFAARLALTEAGDKAMRVEIEIGNLMDRRLEQDDYRKTPLRPHYVFKAPSFAYPIFDEGPISREKLVANSRELAAKATKELLDRFGFNISLEGIKVWQDELKKW